MAHTEPHAPPASGEIPEHPSLPPVQDEAADTPLWVPIVGLVVVGVFAFVVLVRLARGQADEVPVAGETAEQAEGAEAGSPPAR